MLVYNEGVPGSGKSYDALKSHIIPALKQGRTVYVRLNGAEEDSKRNALATYLGMSRERLDELYIHVPTNDVASFFVADQVEGEWMPSEKFQNALVVIDEAHQFYKGGTREPLPQEVEEFFAMARHRGIDVLLLSQFYKRIHTALRYRIERKTTFQKLSALGKVGESRYIATSWQTVAPDKYEKLGSETLSYDPALFPCYRGVTAADVQTAVYSGGRVSVFKQIWKYAIFMLPLSALAVYYLIGFFTGHNSLVKQPQVTPGINASASAGTGGSQATGASKAETKAAKYDTKDMPPEIAYIFDIANQARPRLAASALYDEGRKNTGIVEFWEAQNHVMERISFEQLRALGFDVVLTNYGARLGWHDKALICTPWPMDQVNRVSDQKLREIDARPIVPMERLALGGQPSEASLTAESEWTRDSSDGAKTRNISSSYARSQIPPGTGVIRR